MGRVYTVEFANVSVSAAHDLIGIYAGSSKAFKLHSVTIGQVTATAVGNLRLRINRLTSAVTSGSGGSAGDRSATCPIWQSAQWV